MKNVMMLEEQEVVERDTGKNAMVFDTGESIKNLKNFLEFSGA